MIWVLVGLLLLTYMINKFTLNHGFTNLTYEMQLSKKTAEIGEDIEIISLIENNKLLTISFLKVEEKFPSCINKIQNIYTLFIMPYQRVKRTYKISGKKRGLHKIEDIYLTGYSLWFYKQANKTDVSALFSHFPGFFSRRIP